MFYGVDYPVNAEQSANDGKFSLDSKWSRTSHARADSSGSIDTKVKPLSLVDSSRGAEE